VLSGVVVPRPAHVPRLATKLANTVPYHYRHHLCAYMLVCRDGCGGVSGKDYEELPECGTAGSIFIGLM
jgi:hypothetical protein